MQQVKNSTDFVPELFMFCGCIVLVGHWLAMKLECLIFNDIFLFMILKASAAVLGMG